MHYRSIKFILVVLGKLDRVNHDSFTSLSQIPAAFLQDPRSTVELFLSQKSLAQLCRCTITNGKPSVPAVNHKLLKFGCHYPQCVLHHCVLRGRRKFPLQTQNLKAQFKFVTDRKNKERNFLEEVL